MTDGVPTRRRNGLRPLERYSLRVVLFAGAIVLVAVPFATLLFQVVAEGPLTRLDGRLADDLNDYVHRRETLLDVLRAVTQLGGTIWLAFITVAVSVWLVARGQGRPALFLVVTTAGGAVLNRVVKVLVDRPRPEVDHEVASALGDSFPSGHAMSSVVVYGALLLVLLPVVRGRRARRAVVVAVAALVAAIGSTRLLLGVHFLSDVLGGLILGLAWLAASVAAFEVWRTDVGRRRTEPLSEGVEPETGPALRGDRG